MTPDTIFSASIFVQLAFLFYVIGFLFRDEFWLRMLVLIGTVFYIIYYYTAADEPLWAAIWTSVAIGAANLLMMVLILRERSTLGMSKPVLGLYRWFPTLTPGQFRTLLHAAEHKTAEEDVILCHQGVAGQDVFLIAEGEVMIMRGNRRVALSEGVFIGEISFVLGGPATATVVATAGTRYLRWDRAKLQTLTGRSPALSNGLTALFNADVARKLSVSWPE
ncbi:MAG: cyclic nucleotide-binding domain-containing protein [Pseudomonadota bacterium]